MVLRKFTFDNGLNYIPKSEKSIEKDIQPNTIKNGSNPRKQNKNLSQNNKKILKM